MANRYMMLKNVRHKDTISRNFILFIQTADTLLKYMDACFYKKARLSTIKLIVLRILAANGGKMKPSEIASRTFREQHNITTLVDYMRRDGLVISERNSSNKRLVNVTLTDKGRDVLSQSMLVVKMLLIK